MIRIPQAAPARRIARYRTEIDQAIAGVLDRGRYILGPSVEAFEAAFATYLEVPHCIGVASGTDALALALRALGVGPGDQVITSSLSAAGTAQAICHTGAQPCFVDVCPVTRCLDAVAVEAAITARTSAIVPVHLFGFPADIRELMRVAARHGLAVVEDCAQAHGATVDGRKVGSFGHAAAFSFYPTKNLGAIGDGGAIITSDGALARKLAALRCYGWDGDRRISQFIGFNSRLDELQAAILGVLLRHLDDGNRERQQVALEYRRRLQGLGVALPPHSPGAVYHQFAIATQGRNAVQEALRKAGIGTAVHYFPALHQQPAFAMARSVQLPQTEKLASELLSLPVQPEVAAPNLAYIVDTVERIMTECRTL